MTGNRAGNGALFLRLLRDDRGATAIEYGLIAAMIAIAIITSVMMVGENFAAMWEYVRSHITAALTH